MNFKIYSHVQFSHTEFTGSEFTENRRREHSAPWKRF